MQQFVYVMSSKSGLVKIGVSAHPKVRRAALQTQSGFEVIMEYKCGPFNQATRLESLAHARLSSHRKFGEWFSCSAQQAVDVIKELLCEFEDGEDSRDFDDDRLRRLAMLIVTGREDGELEPNLDMKILDTYRDAVKKHSELCDAFVDACEMLDWYEKQLSDIMGLAERSANEIYALREENDELKRGCENLKQAVT